jgi:hypothetical protein
MGKISGQNNVVQWKDKHRVVSPRFSRPGSDRTQTRDLQNRFSPSLGLGPMAMTYIYLLSVEATNKRIVKQRTN